MALHGPAVAVVLLVVVVVSSGLAERYRLPPPVVLAVVGLGLGLAPGVPAAQVPPEIIQGILLPLLLYAAARDLPEREVRREAGLIGALALGLVLVTAVAVALLASRMTPELSFPLALTLGAMLGATDPVAVTALARRLPLPRRLLVIASSESLFNDATGLVLYRVALSAAVAGAGISIPRATGQFLLLALGGAVAGLLVAELAIRLRGLLHDPLVENATSLLTPLIAFLVAEQVHTSGIMAVVVAGLYVSTRGHRVLSTESRLRLGAVWDMIVFVLEGVIFLLIGLVLPGAVRSLAPEQVPGVLAQAVLVAVLVILARLAWVAAMHVALRLRSGAAGGAGRGERDALPWRLLFALGWTGTRGAVALAAALALPVTYADGRPFESRDLLIVLTVVVVLITLLLQGLTLGPLVRRLRLGDPGDQDAQEQRLARGRAARAALSRLEQLQDEEHLPHDLVALLREPLQARIDQAVPPVDSEGVSPSERREQYHRLRLHLLEVEREELTRVHQRGEIGDTAWRRVLQGLDLEEARLGAGHF